MLAMTELLLIPPKDALEMSDRYRRSEVSFEALLGRKAGTGQSIVVSRPWLREFQKVSTRKARKDRSERYTSEAEGIVRPSQLTLL
jgi:hypothetical protein